MARYQATVTSRRPAADTFAYLATFSNAVHWDPGVLSSKQLDPGPVGPGTRFQLTVLFLGRRMPLIYHVASYRRGHEVVLTATSGLLRATDKIAVTGGADGSAVSYEAEVRLRGPLRILDPLLRPGFRAVAGRAATGLARALSEDRAPTDATLRRLVPPQRATPRWTDAP
jgi:Polyketide cyclase / dehydrase and lipid transport